MEQFGGCSTEHYLSYAATEFPTVRSFHGAKLLSGEIAWLIFDYREYVVETWSDSLSVKIYGID